jgi:DNA-binding protein HU-beta
LPEGGDFVNAYIHEAASGVERSAARGRVGDATLTKADVIDAVAVEAQLSRRKASEIVDLILNQIKGALQKGDRVALNPFGSFVVRARQAREGRNPKTGEKLTIAARKVPAFVAGKALKDAVGGSRSRAKKPKK